MHFQGIKQNRTSIPLLLFGIIAILFSSLNPTIALVGIGIVLVFAGGMVYFRRATEGRARETILTVFPLVTGIVTLLCSCTIKVPMTPNVVQIEIKEKLPVEAGLLITEETRNYIFNGKPESFTGSARPHEFPLGQALENTSVPTFSQIFQKVTLARTANEARNFKIFLEPKIEEFHFRYDTISYALFAVAVISKIKVRVTLASGETKVWERSLESPEQRKGPWVANFGFEREVGESASDALGVALRQIALEIANDALLRDFVQKQM